MIRDSLVKMCAGNIKQWHEYALYTFWADRVKTRKATGLMPYYATHGVEPLLPFDITKATFLTTAISTPLPTANLLVIWARMLQKHNEDLAKIHGRVLVARYTSIQDFKRKNANRISDCNFKSEELVLVLNKQIEPKTGHKCKPRYLGPMAVVRRLRNGAYTLAEVNGTILRLKFAAFHLISYHPRSQKYLEITELVDQGDLEDAKAEEEREVVEDN